ncbi:MAG: hypothetical protein JEZ05_08205 [Tenericutes bacterium]|nr:hypothetical protein [Mycoplasmatota bacterium]
MECVVCHCTDLNACQGGCYWIAEDLCSNCGVILSKTYVQELIDLLKTSGINSKEKVIIELQRLFEEVTHEM